MSVVVVEHLTDGRVRIGNPTQSGFESITVGLNDLLEVMRGLEGERGHER